MSITDDYFDLQAYLEEAGKDCQSELKALDSLMDYINDLESDSRELRAQNEALKKVIVLKDGHKITNPFDEKYIHLELKGG